MKKQFLYPALIFSLITFILTQAFGRTLKIDVTTKSYSGNQAPKSAVAIWIQTTDKKLIKTLAIWGIEASFMLRDWRNITGLGSGGFFDTSNFDGFTGATREAHTNPLQISWDCKDSLGNLVSGEIEFCIEMTESDYWWGTGEVYHGKKGVGKVSIDEHSKVVYGDTSSNCFSNFKATYNGTSSIKHIKGNNFNSKIKLNLNSLLQQLDIKLDTHLPGPKFLSIINLKGERINKLNTIKENYY